MTYSYSIGSLRNFIKKMRNRYKSYHTFYYLSKTRANAAKAKQNKSSKTKKFKVVKHQQLYFVMEK